MIFDRRHFLGAALCAAVGGAAAPAQAMPLRRLAAPVPAAPKAASRPALLDRALAALARHGARVPHHDFVGLVDFGKHSSARRFQLVDVAGGTIAASWLVAHGRGSDPERTGWVRRLSNQPGSNTSSGGSFLLGGTYYGKHGLSRRLIGLDAENSLALERAIVVHGADYVSDEMVGLQGQIGRSLGCFAVAEPTIGEVVRRLGEGRLLFAAR